MNTVWKLKILNTKYKDAEVSFSKPQLLGRNENLADLVINDPLVSDEHVVIIPEEDGVKLELKRDKLSARVGSEVIDENQLVPLKKPIHIGDLILIFAEKDDNWPDNLPDFSQIQDANQAKSAEQTNESLEVTGKKASLMALVGMPLLLLLVGLVYFQTIDANSEPETQTFDLNKTQAALGAARHPHLTLDWNASKRQLSLGGYVESNDDRNDLLKRMESLQIRFTSELRTMDEIKAATIFILKNLDLKAKAIKSGERPGSLVFVTEESELRSWGRAENILQRDVPGLKSWQLEVLQEQPALEQLKTLLEKSSFANKVKVEDKGDRIELIGNLTGQELREFKTMKQSFTKSFGANPYLVLLAPEIIQEESPNLNIAIRAVHIGAVPYVVLDNGRKYFTGGRLPNGTRISSIDSKAVYLQSADDTFAVYFDAL